MRGHCGQLHGTGEYFTSSISTAHSYTRSNGVVIISIIPNVNKFNIKEIKTIDKPDNEKWYVVNNTDTLAFALPIAIINTNYIQDINFECPKKQFNTNLMINDVLYNDGSKFIFFDANTRQIIINNFYCGILVFDITINSTMYNINLKTMSQKNLTTNYKRNIMFR
jgi:hypothetical protein